MNEIGNFEIIEMFKEGDNESLMILINRFDPLLLKYSYLLEYEDAKQDLILHLVTALKKSKLKEGDYQEAKTIKYIKTIVTHEYIRLSKKRRQLQQKEISFEESHSANYNQDFDTTLLFAKILESLPPKQAEVIEKLYLNQMNEGEISRDMGITRQAVNNNKRRAINTLKEKIDLRCVMY